MRRLYGAKLVIVRLDRLPRDAHFLPGLDKADVDVLTADMPNAHRLTVGIIMGMIAENERRLISIRIKGGTQAGSNSELETRPRFLIMRILSKMFSEFLFRFCNRNHVFFTALVALLALQPLVARADQCDDAWARHQRGTPEIKAAIARSASVNLFATDVDEVQKDKCDTAKANDDLSQLVLDSARQVEQACAGRRKLVCDVACQEKSLSESKKKTAYECSPAALDAARKADQAEKNQQDAERNVEMKVQNACISVAAADTFPDLPHDSDYKKDVKLCNANPKTCKSVREALNGQKWPSDLTCGG